MRIAKRIAQAVVVGMIVAAATVGVRIWKPTWTGEPRPPRLDCPALVDIGPQPEGEVATGRFRVANLGGLPLSLTQFKTSCSCAGVETVEDGVDRLVQSAVIPPGADCEFLVKISVGGRAGTSQSLQVQFATNDPDMPVVVTTITIPRITGGIYAEPRAALFGDVKRGDRPVVAIKLYDNHMSGQQIQDIVSRHPDRFTVRYIPVGTDDPPEEHPIAGRLLGRCEVTPITDRAGPLDGVVEVNALGGARPLAMISVAGRVSAAVTAFPSALVFPRTAGEKTEWSSEITLASRDSKTFDVSLVTVPDNFQVTVHPVEGRPDQIRLRVVCPPADSNVLLSPIHESRILLRVKPSSGGPEDLAVIVAHPSRGQK